jgi:hypothetical protein
MTIRKESFSPATRLVAVAGLACAAAFAQAVSYPNFASTTGLSLLGSAATAQTADGTVLRLTTSETNKAGSAFTAGTVPFSAQGSTFSAFFQFRITSPGGIQPADGIVFVLRDTGTSAIGQIGGGQGYDGIGNSIAVKFDTYQNINEMNDNHVAVQSNGVSLEEFTQTPYGVANCTNPTGVAGCMSNGDLWSVWIDYDGASIHVALADGSTTRPADLLSGPLAVPSLLKKASGVFVGFTAATGAGTENHDVVNLQFYGTYNPTPIGVQQTLPAVLISQTASPAASPVAQTGPVQYVVPTKH